MLREQRGENWIHMVILGDINYLCSTSQLIRRSVVTIIEIVSIIEVRVFGEARDGEIWEELEKSPRSLGRCLEASGVVGARREWVPARGRRREQAANNGFPRGGFEALDFQSCSPGCFLGREMSRDMLREQRGENQFHT